MYRSQPLSSVYRANAAAGQGPQTRQDLSRRIGATGETPTIWDAVNYPSEGDLDFATYWLRYQRQALAKAIIDKPANATWQEPPEILSGDKETGETQSDASDAPGSSPVQKSEETEESDETRENAPMPSEEEGGSDTSSFEEAVDTLMSGESLRRSPMHRFNVVDRLASLGEFAILVFGFRDGANLSQPVASVNTDPTDEMLFSSAPFDGLNDLMYISIFGQDRIEDMEIETDMKSPRYQLPKTYEVTTGSDEAGNTETVDVHWTRAIHVPEGTMVNDVRGQPSLKSIFHNLLNIDKILAASGEGYWRGGYRGLVVRPPESPGGGVMDFADSDNGSGSAALQQEIAQFTNNMQRTIATTGRVNTLDVDIADPMEHVQAQMKPILSDTEIPKSILIGQEYADRASEEDRSQWYETIAQRRNNWAEPVLLRPFLERLIALGILPPPTNGFNIEWQPLDEQTEMEKAEFAKLMAQAIKAISAGRPLRLASPAELRHVLGWGPEIGSEVPIGYEDPDLSLLTDRAGPETKEVLEMGQDDDEDNSDSGSSADSGNQGGSQ